MIAAEPEKTDRQRKTHSPALSRRIQAAAGKEPLAFKGLSNASKAQGSCVKLDALPTRGQPRTSFDRAAATRKKRRNSKKGERYAEARLYRE
jgi:hypothetical protein